MLTLSSRAQYLPVLQEQLEALRKATNVAAGGTEGITAGAVRAYAGKVADLKAVLSATMQVRVTLDGLLAAPWWW